MFDYVSTVSGGGYIGGCWLVAWMHHQGIGIKDIEERLSAPPNLPGEAGDLPEVHFLRDYSLPDARKRIPEGGLLGVCDELFEGHHLESDHLGVGPACLVAGAADHCLCLFLSQRNHRIYECGPPHHQGDDVTSFASYPRLDRVD